MGVIGIKDSQNSLQEDITIDAQADARVALKTAEALAAATADRTQIHQATRNSGLTTANTKDHIWEIGRAVEDIATLLLIVLSTVNLAIVVLDNAVIHEKESSTSVGNSVNGLLVEVTTTNTITSTGELPETLGVIDWCVGNLTGMFAAIDEAEVVCTWSVVLQIGCEDVAREQTLLDATIEPGGLSSRLDSVDGAESQTKKSIVLLVLSKLRADLRCQFDSLSCNSNATN